MLSLQLGFDLFVAALIGMAVGLEREWSGHTQGPDARFAGLRTFTMLGAIGGFAGWFLRIEQPVVAALLVGGAVLFAVVAYASTVRLPGATSDGTTEVAAILVVALGVTSGFGNRTVASAAASLLLILLAEKSSLHRALKHIDESELRATLQFAVLALVVLPLLPDRGFGPYGAFVPRQLWTVVLLFSALNFAGYIARRLIGETRGLGLTGLLGGLISSTAVTFTFSRRSREDESLALPLAFGVAAACTVLVPRVIVIATVLQRALFDELLPVLAPPLAVGIAILGFALWRERDRRAKQRGSGFDDAASTTSAASRNPLALGTSIKMAAAFQVVLFVIAWAHATIGDPGVLASAAVVGLTDMDALTMSMSRFAGDASQVHIAAVAIGIGVLANTFLKLGIVMVLGTQRFRLYASAALVMLAVGSGLGLWWRW